MLQEQAGSQAPNGRLIRLEGITRVYRMGDVEVQALRGVEFDIHEGEWVAIMGPSGSGKSTLMNILGCLDQPSAGRYWLAGIDVSTLDDNALADVRGRRIGFVFQQFNLLPRTSALQNVELPLMYTDTPGNRRRRALEALEAVGLSDRVHHRPNEMSGGQQQRVAIARALVNNPSIILADEPTGNLDSKTGEEIMALFRRLYEERHITIIFVTHDASLAARVPRRILLKDGMVVADERQSVA
jgi:putative ABC transport system ATP-binding protein